MKILVFVENTHCGGLDTFIISLINRWPHPEDELTLLCNEDHPGLQVIRKRLTRPCEIKGHNMPVYVQIALRLQKKRLLHILRKSLGPILKYLFFLYNIFALRSLLLKDNPDRLLVINGGYPGGDSCRAAVISWKLFSGKKPAILNVHNLDSSPRWFEKIQEAIVDYGVAHSSLQIVCVSQACADSLIQRKSLSRYKKATFIYNGIMPHPNGGLEKENAKEQLKIPPDVLLCSVLATYEPRKGHSFLLNAFQKIVEESPQAYLFLCGYGKPYEVAQIQDLVRASPVAHRIRIDTFLEDTQVVMKATDLFLIPSQSYESFGLVAVEAFAAKTPVVSTTVGGLVEVLKNGEGGFVVDPCDQDGFAKKVTQLLNNPSLRKEQGEKGYQRYQKMFTADRMAREYATLLRN
jgi:L-malate glycosyltransferase